MRNFMRNLFVIFLFPIFMYSQGWNTELIGNLEYSQELNDVWGYTANDGNEYALVGTETGTSIVRINEGLSGLQEVAFIPGNNSIWRDIKTYGHYMYVGTEASQGIQVVDIEDPEMRISKLLSSSAIIFTLEVKIAEMNVSEPCKNAFQFVFANNL